MKKFKHRLKMRKVYAVALLIVSIVVLAKLNTKEYLLVLTMLYVVSLAPAYAIQAENGGEKIDYRVVFGFAIVFALASLMAYFFMNLAINGL
jgi:hypothetical protein